jgi:hypothetical protein
MQLDFRQFGKFPDAKTFLAERAQYINTSNQEMQALHKKVKDGLLIMKDESDDEIILHTMPLKALVFRNADDRKGYINKTYVNYGEYPIDTVEVYYGEYIRGGETSAIRWVKLNLRGIQPDKTVPVFCKTNGFGGWDDEKLSWGRNCFFLNKDEYFLFKETITQLGKDLGLIE